MKFLMFFKTAHNLLNNVFFKKERATNTAHSSSTSSNDFSNKEVVRNQIALHWRTIDCIEGISPSPERIKCPLCHHKNHIEDLKVYTSHCIFGGGRLKRYQCANCDLIFGPLKMLNLTPDELSDEYEMHYKVYTEGDSTEREIRSFHALNPSKQGTYLNYGSGVSSETLTRLRDDGWHVLGYEPHQEAGTTIANFIITSKEQLETIQFDGIFSNNVLEHFRDPISELKSISKLLKPMGKMSHATPCFEYLYEYTRFHLYFFTGRSKDILFHDAGLEITEHEKDGDFINVVATRK